MTVTQNKLPIPKRIAQVEHYMKDRVGLGVSFDLGVRKITVLDKKVQIYYVNGLNDAIVVERVLQSIVTINDNHSEDDNSILFEIIENRINHQSVEKVKTLDEAVDQVLSGLIAVFVDGETEAFIVDTRSYPGRQPEEPDTEKVVRGSRDGFVENIIQNTALLRRRIRDERLRIEMLHWSQF